MNIPMIISLYPQNDPIILGYTHPGIPSADTWPRRFERCIRAEDPKTKACGCGGSVWRAAWDGRRPAKMGHDII